MFIPLKLTLYGLLYTLSLNYFYIKSKALLPEYIKTKYSDLSSNNFIFFTILTSIAGARIMTIILYYPISKWNSYILFSGKTGMCFFGGALGSYLYFLIIKYFYKVDVVQIVDKIIVNLPICIFLIRIANFINSECLGLYYDTKNKYRYCTQIYEALFEGFILFIILNYWKDIFKKKVGMTTGVFLMLYSLFRFSVEYFKIQDLPMFYSFSIWQIFCIQFFFCGLFLIIK